MRQNSPFTISFPNPGDTDLLKDFITGGKYRLSSDLTKRMIDTKTYSKSVLSDI